MAMKRSLAALVLFLPAVVQPNASVAVTQRPVEIPTPRIEGLDRTLRDTGRDRERIDRIERDRPDAEFGPDRERNSREAEEPRRRPEEPRTDPYEPFR